MTENIDYGGTTVADLGDGTYQFDVPNVYLDGDTVYFGYDAPKFQGILVEGIEKKGEDMFTRQQFLDACQDAGVTIGRIERETIRDADDKVWEEFLANLVVRAIGRDALIDLFDNILFEDEEG